MEGCSRWIWSAQNAVRRLDLLESLWRVACPYSVDGLQGYHVLELLGNAIAAMHGARDIPSDSDVLWSANCPG